MPKLKLVSFPLCPYTHTCVITLHAKGLVYDHTLLSWSEPPPDWFATISPLGKAPVLIVDNRTSVFESTVINEYLHSLAATPVLMPTDSLHCALARDWIALAMELTGLQYQMLIAADQAAFEKLLAQVEHYLARTEQHLTETKSTFFYDGLLQQVDIAYTPMLYRFRVMERRHASGIFSKFPAIAAWTETLLRTPPIVASLQPSFEEEFFRIVGDFNSYASCFYQK